MRDVLNDRCVIVTGAGRGLGRAYAVDLAVAGAAVVVNDVDAEAAEEVVRELQSTGSDAVGDFHSVSDWETSGEIIQTALSTFGRLDGLVNNAGIFYVTDPQDEDPLMAAEMVQINLLGTLYCGQHAIRHMAGHGGGSIVNDTSGAQSGMPRRGTYGATKGATASLTYSWAMDLAEVGIRVNAVSPIARTAMVEYGVARGEPGTEIPPGWVAPLVTYLISDDARDVTGQVVRLEGSDLSILSKPGAHRRTAKSDIWDHATLAATIPGLCVPAPPMS